MFVFYVFTVIFVLIVFDMLEAENLSIYGKNDNYGYAMATTTITVIINVLLFCRYIRYMKYKRYNSHIKYEIHKKIYSSNHGY